MPDEAVGFAPGKLLLLGEHAVVYGAPALGFPLERGVKARLRPGRGRVRARLARGLPRPEGETSAEPRELVERALGALAGELDVELELQVPPMCGYGSSAAVAVALLRARSAWLGKKPGSRRKQWEQALEVERAAHATPSGVDPAIVVWGSPLRFQRVEGAPVVRRQAVKRPVHLLAGWCGVHGGTRFSVSGLAALRDRRPTLVGRAMDTLAEAADVGGNALARGLPEELGHAMNLAHGVLSGLGLVGDRVEHAVRQMRSAGALGAKMSGAGGAGGAWIALFEDAAGAQRARRSLSRELGPLWLETLG